MARNERGSLWRKGEAYDSFMGRWSALVAAKFLDWLDQDPQLRWLDVGCGMGALSTAITRHWAPLEVVGVDASPEFVALAQATSSNDNQRFVIGNAESLPFGVDSFDAAVSGLVLNFVPRKERAVAELHRVVRPGGIAALYVWDYSGRMEFLRHFWDAATALDQAARSLDEGVLFPVCRLEPLVQLFHDCGFEDVQAKPIDVPTRFTRFEDYWNPFLGGQGPAGAYCESLSEDRRTKLRERLRESIPSDPDGVIRMVARAWAVRGHVE